MGNGTYPFWPLSKISASAPGKCCVRILRSLLSWALAGDVLIAGNLLMHPSVWAQNLRDDLPLPLYSHDTQYTAESSQYSSILYNTATPCVTHLFRVDCKIVADEIIR